MTITGAIVLFAVIWFMALLIALPINLTSQEESGEITPGTPPSAPVDPQIGKKMKWVTLISFLIWLPICGVIASGWITVQDIDIWKRP